MRRLYWFQNDLRLQDNPGLLAQADADQLLLVYLWPRNRPWCNLTGMGRQRERFLRESLRALQAELESLGQGLLVLEGAPETVLPALVEQFRPCAVATSRTPGYYERKTVECLRHRLPVPLDIHRGSTLFPEEGLPSGLEALPAHFTPFREQVERLSPSPPRGAPRALPPPPAVTFAPLPPSGIQPPAALPLRGGTAAGRRRLRQFVFEQQSIRHYKETRNCLDGLDGSSTLSPWLATGCLSPREVAGAVAAFEREQGRNASTYWLYFELLWREYFHWRALQDDASLFRFRQVGPGRETPGPAGPGGIRWRHCTFEPRSFARWCQGDTDYPLVNALMHQLVETGWMSNRGRQIAASCLINELQLDWRYGAAFFEKHLLDYDVASNYGNWQYLAGVGADPRGGRHFNLEKQAREHDPDGVFTAKWDGYRPPQPAFVTDAADWPLQDP